ncbi:amino acid-binding ACT domain protein [Thermodesulfatator indicus DSM 15286]|uniref:Amino acid-binding ACT domain protein n=1 Tax=Thermodesulfatator indicus (strain DSM 15286 / JCM 11887 / CIR29812) TaxID=667014 RepID=F8ABG0_THEID|nr:MBL fold metallo-hydrolase [Thermodesulfatator indicus]AEH44471.1 amino acid-binding ACT domain protein [Thermodesulfatator indicus DSM 15286]
MNKKFYFVARMPDEPGALHRAAEVVRRYQGNINRIHYDRRIDPNTVFFEITLKSEEDYQLVRQELQRLGYLQESIAPLKFLKFNVYLPHRPGALFEFLNYVTEAQANIAFLDFDEKGPHPDRLTVSLTVEGSTLIDKLLNNLKSRYRLEILEYDTWEDNLDNTVFYLKFAQKLRNLIDHAEDEFLLRLLNDINHIVQELTNLNQDPKEVFAAILATGQKIKENTGTSFYADVQQIEVTQDVQLFSFQPPCGGNIFVLKAPHEMVMIDTGFGIYHEDVLKMLQHYGLGDLTQLSRIYITHADADHAGAAGFFDSITYLHEGTWEIIQKANRAYGSRVEGSILEEVYTKLINLFSRFTPPLPEKIKIFPKKVLGLRNIFPIIHRFKVGSLEIEVLESLGGHLYGQVFFYSPVSGLLFTGDSLLNVASFTPERKEFVRLAKILMTSVNVDREKAIREREALIALAKETDETLKPLGRRCLVCGGHGAVSVFEGEELKTYGPVETYHPA